MSNSISIRLVVSPADEVTYGKGKDGGGRGASLPHLQFISLEIGDIDSPSGSGAVQDSQRGTMEYGGSKGAGSNFLEKGDIDFRPPGGGSNWSSHKLGERNSSGAPDDVVKDFMPLISFLSKLFGKQKQDDGNPVEMPDGGSSPKRKNVNHDDDLKTEAPSPSKPQTVNKDDKVKSSSPSTNANTSVSGSSPAGPVLPPHKGVVEVNKPIIVGPNEVFDGKNQLFKAGPGLNGGGTAETQEPVFILAPGAQLKNVQFEGGDGIHLLGDAKLDNVHAVHGGPDDMVTIDGPGNKAHDAQLAGIPLSEIPSNKPANVEIQNSSFRHSHDKAIQVNGDANIKLKGVYAEDVGQLLVTLGGAPITAHVSIEDSEIKDLRSHLFRLDSHNSTLDIASDVKTDNGQIQVMMGDPSKASGATRVMASTARA